MTVNGFELSLGSKIGSGSYGTVFVATDAQGVEWDVKLEPMEKNDFLPLILRESVVMEQLAGNPFTPKCLGCANVPQNGVRALAMERLGSSLLDQALSFPVNTRLSFLESWFPTLLTALTSVHQSFTVHGDVKLEHFLTDPKDSNRVVLVDWGSSGSSTFMGTPAYTLNRGGFEGDFDALIASCLDALGIGVPSIPVFDDVKHLKTLSLSDIIDFW